MEIDLKCTAEGILVVSGDEAYDKMDEAAFRDLYERVKIVLFAIFLKNISEEEFLNALADF